MTEAVENEGISVERYQQILNRVQSDRELLQRVKKQLKDASRRTRI
jgi:hypothetical protein